MLIPFCSIHVGGAMQKGDLVKLNMQKALCIGAEINEDTYECIVLQYDDKQECIYLALQNSELTELSLDAIYKCENEKGTESCVGRLKERYCKESYKVLKMQVKNGFYKISVNSVDK